MEVVGGIFNIEQKGGVGEVEEVFGRDGIPPFLFEMDTIVARLKVQQVVFVGHVEEYDQKSYSS